MSKIYVGIDNGCTGTIGIIGDDICEFHKTPSKKEQDYTKKKKNISRLDVVSFVSLFSRFNKNDLVFVMERPMINNLRFNASVIAARCFESELSQIELMVQVKIWLRLQERQTAERRAVLILEQDLTAEQMQAADSVAVQQAQAQQVLLAATTAPKMEK